MPFFLLHKSMHHFGGRELNTLHSPSGYRLTLLMPWKLAISKKKKEKKFDDYKRHRNKVTNLVRAAKKAYFEKLINHNKDTSALWKTMNEITRKSRNKSASSEIKCSPYSFNEHFLSLSESILKSTDNSFFEDYEISPLLEKFCQDRISSADCTCSSSDCCPLSWYVCYTSKEQEVDGTRQH